MISEGCMDGLKDRVTLIGDTVLLFKIITSLILLVRWVLILLVLLVLVLVLVIV